VILIAFLAVGAIAAVELLQIKVKQDYYHAKIKAARQMEHGMRDLRKARSELGIPVDDENDPTGSGIIGWPLSYLTSNTGYLYSKQTTINPNFAAVAVHLLKKAGVEKGDVVAVGFSGSFPALNLAILCACEALGLEPIIISSAAASEWGANIPGFTWLEMEEYLHKMNFSKHTSRAASLGGVGDKGHGMSKEGKKALKKIIADAGLPLIWPKSMDDGIEQRMAIYQETAGVRPIKAYINVGGGTVSVGTAIGKRLFKPGLNRRMPPRVGDIRSVMVRFASEGIPVIHFTKIKDLAARYGLPSPVLERQQVGKGNIFYKLQYNTLLVIAMLAFLCLSLWFLVRMNLAHRFSAGGEKRSTADLPEPMV